MNQNQTESKPQDVKESRDEGLDETTCSPSFWDTPETDDAVSTAECESDLVMSMRSMEMRRNEAIQEATNAVNDIIRIEWECARYKTALEGIAGFPHQYFDTETPWHMRKLAEHALSLENK